VETDVLRRRINAANVETIKNPHIKICSLLESRVNETIQEIRKADFISESDILDSELRILDWIGFFTRSARINKRNW
jgi:hypothetical protein